MTKTLAFQGYSDDTFGCDEIDHDNCASGEPIRFCVSVGDTGLIVSGQYAPEHCGGWLVGVSTYDPFHDDVPLPEWPLTLTQGDSPYSPKLVIEAPDEATVELLGHGEL